MNKLLFFLLLYMVLKFSPDIKNFVIFLTIYEIIILIFFRLLLISEENNIIFN